MFLAAAAAAASNRRRRPGSRAERPRTRASCSSRARHRPAVRGPRAGQWPPLPFSRSIPAPVPIKALMRASVAACMRCERDEPTTRARLSRPVSFRARPPRFPPGSPPPDPAAACKCNTHIQPARAAAAALSRSPSPSSCIHTHASTAVQLDGPHHIPNGINLYNVRTLDVHDIYTTSTCYMHIVPKTMAIRTLPTSSQDMLDDRSDQEFF